MIAFAPPSSDKNCLEEGAVLSPRFDSAGLITAVVVDSEDGAVLMLAHMDREALALTLSSGIGHFYSRSRGTLWKKGETSGNLLEVKEIRTDCDQDAIVMKVQVAGQGVTCHTGRRSCFYRQITLTDGQTPTLISLEDKPKLNTDANQD